MTSSMVSCAISGTNFTPTHAITYTYIEVRITNSRACYTYVMWAECALGFEFSIQSSVFGATNVAKVNLFST